jgi:enoyl-CoA hydratase/3-hydroxyacyl-CoA dehydrogenase
VAQPAPDARVAALLERFALKALIESCLVLEEGVAAIRDIDLGIIPGFGGTQRLPRLVGEARALVLNLSGEPIGSEEAYAFGLVNRVVPDHELLDTALAWARKLGGQAPRPVGHIKRVSAAGELDAGIAAEKESFAATFGSADGREGIAAFLVKRAPRWTGT